MAVSSSTDLKSTGTEFVTNARRLLGISAEEESLQSHELTTGLYFLSVMLKDWQSDPDLGTHLETEGSLTLSDSDGSYTFQAAGDFTTVPFEIKQIRISHDGGNEIEMTRISREDYYRLPSRTTEGFPTQWFYDRQRDGGTLYIWPEPDDSLYDLTFTYRRRIMDMDAGTDNIDLPPEWEWAVVTNLAKTMIPIYARAGTPEAMQVVVDAETSLAKLKAFDIANDGGSVVMSRERSRYRHG
jgi:hypothetical protein